MIDFASRQAVGVFLFAFLAAPVLAAENAPQIQDGIVLFVDNNCLDCHDAEQKKGGLDLSALALDLRDETTFAQWVKVHDRVRDGEMPPEIEVDPRQRRAFTAALFDALWDDYATPPGVRAE